MLEVPGFSLCGTLVREGIWKDQIVPEAKCSLVSEGNVGRTEGESRRFRIPDARIKPSTREETGRIGSMSEGPDCVEGDSRNFLGGSGVILGGSGNVSVDH